MDADFTFRNGGLACLRSVFLIRKTLKVGIKNEFNLFGSIGELWWTVVAEDANENESQEIRVQPMARLLLTWKQSL